MRKRLKVYAFCLQSMRKRLKEYLYKQYEQRSRDAKNLRMFKKNLCMHIYTHNLLCI